MAARQADGFKITQQEVRCQRVRRLVAQGCTADYKGGRDVLLKLLGPRQSPRAHDDALDCSLILEA